LGLAQKYSKFSLSNGDQRYYENNWRKQNIEKSGNSQTSSSVVVTNKSSVRKKEEFLSRESIAREESFSSTSQTVQTLATSVGTQEYYDAEEYDDEYYNYYDEEEDHYYLEPSNSFNRHNMPRDNLSSGKEKNNRLKRSTAQSGTKSSTLVSDFRQYFQ